MVKKKPKGKRGKKQQKKRSWRKRQQRKERRKEARKEGNGKNRKTQREGRKEKPVARIGPNTPYGLCTERLSPFGGALALVKFLDLIGFEELFEERYVKAKRQPVLGDYRMVLGLLLLLFSGFQRVGHFVYIQKDSMLRGILKVSVLPVVTTFWRYLRSLGIVQAEGMIRLMAALRARVWALNGYAPKRVSVNADTTAATVYGQIEGARVCYNPWHRGRKALRPFTLFVQETREYLCGHQRRGATLSDKEVAREFRSIRRYLPACVQKVLVRGDGELISWESVKACLEENLEFIFGNRRCTPPFSDKGWYRRGKYEYNECWYQPAGWGQACRFVAMRIRKNAPEEDRQGWLIKDLAYTYRIFVTNLGRKPHQVIAEYDQRANVENCIGEAQREGLLAIPSKSFQANAAFFQLVLFSYNLWRWMKLVAGHQMKQEAIQSTGQAPERIPIVDNTVAVARLKILYVAAKISTHDNREKVYYSIHESRAAGMIDFLEYLDCRRKQPRPWRSPPTATLGVAVA